MAKTKVQLVDDITGDVLLPETSADQVLTESGKNVEEKFEDVEGEVSQLQQEKTNNKPGKYLGNFYNLASDLLGWDISTIDGHLTPGAGGTTYSVSDKIVMDFSKAIIITGTRFPYAYCYAADDTYLGRIQGLTTAAILADTYPTIAYFRMAIHNDDRPAIMVQYNLNKSASYLPYNPIRGYYDIAHQNLGSLFRGFFEVDTVNKKLIVRRKDTGNIIILGKNGEQINTNVANGTEVLFGAINEYFLIAYRRSTDSFTLLWDYRGDWSDLIVFAFVDSLRVQWASAAVVLNKNRFEALKFGAFYKGSYLDIDTTNKKCIFHLASTGIGNSHILCTDGSSFNTGFSDLAKFSIPSALIASYFTICYSLLDNSLHFLQDYTFTYSDYVILGYYDYTRGVYGNLGKICVDGVDSVVTPQYIKTKLLTYGYIYFGGVLNINTDTQKFRIVGGSGCTHVICTDGRAIRHNITLNTDITLSGFNGMYFTILYDIANQTIIGKIDYTGDYSNYIILGYYDHGYVYGNMGPVTINGSIKNKEIEKAFEEYEIPEIETLVEQVQQNTTSIGVNAANIASEASARQSADTALGARIDNLVAPSGQSIAEITDARVGYNGITYASLAARLNAEAGRVRNVLVVGTDGQYQTISAAVSAAQNGDIVFIKRGVYEEHVVNRDKVIHIIGESKEEVIWKYPNTNYGSCDCYDCGMGSIRNLTMWNYDNGGTPSGEYGRSYCIHIDHQTYYVQHPPISNYFFCENVHFINDSNECLGLGLRNNMIMEFVNCDFETLSGDEASFYVHAASATNAKCVLKNCTIRNNSTAGQKAALRIEGYYNTEGGCTAVLERNILVNLGGGPKFTLQNRRSGVWSDVDWGEADWLLDARSQLNNETQINA